MSEVKIRKAFDTKRLTSYWTFEFQGLTIKIRKLDRFWRISPKGKPEPTAVIPMSGFPDAQSAADFYVQNFEKIKQGHRTLPKRQSEGQEKRELSLDEAVSLLTKTDTPVPLIVERFTFAPSQGVILSYNSQRRAAVVTRALDSHQTQCGDLNDFRQALSDFARQAKKFMDSRGLMSVGKPFMCDSQFMWEVKNNPNDEGTFKPKKTDEPGSYFSPETRQRAKQWRDKTYSQPQNKGFVERFLDQFS